jgi:hypothetical protein
MPRIRVVHGMVHSNAFVPHFHHGQAFGPARRFEFDVRGRTKRSSVPSREGSATVHYKNRVLRLVQVDN